MPAGALMLSSGARLFICVSITFSPTILVMLNVAGSFILFCMLSFILPVVGLGEIIRKETEIVKNDKPKSYA